MPFAVKSSETPACEYEIMETSRNFRIALFLQTTLARNIIPLTAQGKRIIRIEYLLNLLRKRIARREWICKKKTEEAHPSPILTVQNPMASEQLGGPSYKFCSAKGRAAL